MWRVVDSCTDHTVAPPEPPAPECEGYFEVVGWRVDGTIWYAASGGYEADMRVLVDGTVRIDNDCSIALTGAELSSASCEMIGSELLAEPEFVEATCALADVTCGCDVTIADVYAGGGGWMVESNRLIHTGTPVPAGEDFCVEGTVMRQRADLDDASLYLELQRIDS